MNPVQDLFQQVVDNTTLSPEYNDGRFSQTFMHIWKLKTILQR